MSNVSIFEKNWTDLVFEGKNKAYGAYQLRQENPKTSLIAFISGVALIFSLIGGWFALSSFGNHPDGEIIDDTDGPTVVVVDVTPPPPPPSNDKPNVTPPPPASAPETENKNKAYVADRNPDNVDIPKNTDPKPETPAVDPNAGVPGGEPSNIPSGPGTVFAPGNGGGDNNPVAPSELDRLPEYPGKIQKFYEYIANNIKPNDDTVTSINVTMAFVIEKDGSMTDIRVVRSNDKYLEKEAIRVLKSIKVKWSPGYKDGEKVRTQYTIPIRIAIQ